MVDIFVTASYYSVEACCDYLTIGNRQYRGSDNGPFNVVMAAGTTAQWRSDGSVVSGGFNICASLTQRTGPPPPPPSPSPPPLPPATPGSWWTVLSGGNFASFNAVGNAQCITDGFGRYGNNERCVIAANRDMYASALNYTVESCCDYITIGNTQYRGLNRPFNVFMRRGSTLSWRSDGSISYGGFDICAYETMLPGPPPPRPTASKSAAAASTATASTALPEAAAAATPSGDSRRDLDHLTGREVLLAHQLGHLLHGRRWRVRQQ